MRFSLWLASLLLVLFAAMHIFIAFEHRHQVVLDRESVIGPALKAFVAAGLAGWAFRRASRG